MGAPPSSRVAGRKDGLLAGSTKAEGLQDAAATRDGVRALVLALLCLGVGLGQPDQDVVRGLGVVVVACPGFQGGRLQSAAVGEGQPPGAVGALFLQGLQTLQTFRPVKYPQTANMAAASCNWSGNL